MLGAPELSKRIGIPRTTTFRLLQTLEALGFLERVNGDRYFRLGVGVLRLGFEYLNSLELTDLGAPVLERLRDATSLSTHLLIRDQRDVVFVAKAQSNTSMFGSVKVHVGTRLPAHATVHGHVLMGDLTRDALRQLYPEKRLEQFTERTPGTVDELYERVRHYARLGYAVSEAAFESGISAVTAPVRDHSTDRRGDHRDRAALGDRRGPREGTARRSRVRRGGRPVTAAELSSARKRSDLRARAPQGRDVLSVPMRGRRSCKCNTRMTKAACGPLLSFQRRTPDIVQNEWWIPVSTITWFAVLDTPAVKNAAFAPPEPCSYNTFA